MTMDKAEIIIDYRRAANKQKQIKIMAQLNQCAERKIAEILVDAGEELPKKYQEMLLKPSRRSWKFPEEPEAPETEPPEAPEATEPAPMTAEVTPAEDRQRPGENGVPVAPRNEDEARHWVDGVGPMPVEAPEETATVTLDPSVWDRAVERKIEPGEISAETLLRAACRLMASALALNPDEYHAYSCGVLDLVHALLEDDG